MENCLYLPSYIDINRTYLLILFIPTTYHGHHIKSYCDDLVKSVTVTYFFGQPFVHFKNE